LRLALWLDEDVLAGLAALGSLGAEEDWKWEEVVDEAGIW
jgi:hypothetical protein